MFLRNAWYVAGWSRDFGRTLTAETILGDEIVFYRQEDGTPVALENACPHRKLPLSMGALQGDQVQCGYHGLTFGADGRCVAAPTQPGQTPKRAVVHSYPVIDRYRLLWIWMGETDAADSEAIYSISNHDDPDWGLTEGGSLDFACHYLWIADNLLDPSHVAWVHPTSFAGSGTDNVPLELETGSDGVTVSRWIRDEAASPYYADLLPFDGACDRLQHYEMAYPAIGINKTIFTPAGRGGPDRAVEADAFINISYNFMTPVDADRTRYFWFQHRNTAPKDTAISERMNKGAYEAFCEDKAVLEAVHLGMKSPRSPNLNLTLDAGAQLFRRGLEARIAAESEAESAAD